MGKVTPEGNKKLPGISFHVSTPTLSVVNLTCHLEKAAEYDDIKKIVKQEWKPLSRTSLAILKTRLFPMTLTVTQTPPPLMLAAAIVLNDHSVNLISWYNSEFSNSNRVVNLMVHMASQE